MGVMRNQLSATTPFSARIVRSLPIASDPTMANWRALLMPLVKRPLPPSVPLNFQVTNARGGLSLSWAPVQRTSPSHGPDGFELLRSVDGSFTGDVQIIPIKNPQQTAYFDSFGSPTTVSYRIRATAGSSTSPQSVRGPHSGVVRHTSLDPTDATSVSTTQADQYTNERVRSQARFGNYGLAQYQENPTIQSAPSSGIGGGTQPIAPGAPPSAPGSVQFSAVLGSVNTGQTLTVGDGSKITTSGTGINDANSLNGNPVNAASPSDTQALTWNATNGDWEAENVVASVSGTANQIASTGGNTPVLSLTSPVEPPGNVQIPSANVYQISTDTGISRDSAGVVDIGNGTAGDKSGSVNAANATLSALLQAATVEITGATPTGTGTNLGLGNTTGFGNGAAATPVTTTLLGTGSGPANPQTVVKYLEIDLGGTKYWLPLVQ